MRSPLPRALCSVNVSRVHSWVHTTLVAKAGGKASCGRVRRGASAHLCMCVCTCLRTHLHKPSAVCRLYLRSHTTTPAHNLPGHSAHCHYARVHANPCHMHTCTHAHSTTRAALRVECGVSVLCVCWPSACRRHRRAGPLHAPAPEHAARFPGCGVWRGGAWGVSRARACVPEGAEGRRAGPGRKS